jgi:hypothetical protein
VHIPNSPQLLPATTMPKGKKTHNRFNQESLGSFCPNEQQIPKENVENNDIKLVLNLIQEITKRTQFPSFLAKF